jgi:hypothetical protein
LNPTDVVACTNLKHEELQSSPSERYIRFPEALTQFELGSKKEARNRKMLTGDGVVGIGEGKGSPNPQMQADPTTPLRLLGARPIGERNVASPAGWRTVRRCHRSCRAHVVTHLRKVPQDRGLLAGGLCLPAHARPHRPPPGRAGASKI